MLLFATFLIAKLLVGLPPHVFAYLNACDLTALQINELPNKGKIN